MLAYFKTSKHTVFGTVNQDTREITLPSGYTMPIENDGINDYVVYQGEKCTLVYVS